jgi:hypothetical protein
VTATSVGTQIRLNWLLAGWAAGYNIKYSTNSGGPYALVASNATGGCYTNTGLTLGKIYYFVDSSMNATAESANSAEVSARAGLLNKTGWVASASSSNAPDPPANAIDGNINSRWSTGANQVPGQWFQVDMGSTNILSAIVFGLRRFYRGLSARLSGVSFRRWYQLGSSSRDRKRGNGHHHQLCRARGTLRSNHTDGQRLGKLVEYRGA